MNGAESLVHTLIAGGVEVCFTNPGTSEMHMVAALDRITGMRPVLGLFEGVVTGAADGYARMAGKPAATLLHLGPGLGNGAANLHNAAKAQVPVINIVGDHARAHRGLGAPLESDIETLARNFSTFVRTVAGPDDLVGDAGAALRAALAPPGGVATLILPADIAWSPAPDPGAPIVSARRASVPDHAIAQAVAALTSGAPAALFLGGVALTARGLSAAGRVAARTGCRLISDTFSARMARGAGLPVIERLPYFAEQAVEALTGLDHLVIAGTKAPIAFFAYPGKASHLTPPGTAVHGLAGPEADVEGALEALAEALGARDPGALASLSRPARPTGALNPSTLGQAFAALLPEGAIVMDESATGGAAAWFLTQSGPRHDWLFLTGGSIGQGLPCATGAAVACPDRKVVCLHGDGGAMYTLQALWTQARERLDVVTVILANRKYAILQIELARVGAGNPGRRALDMLDLSNPSLDWVALGRGMGVESSRAETAEAFADQLAAALATPGPHLIEAVL